MSSLSQNPHEPIDSGIHLGAISNNENILNTITDSPSRNAINAVLLSSEITKTPSMSPDDVLRLYQSLSPEIQVEPVTLLGDHDHHSLCIHDETIIPLTEHEYTLMWKGMSCRDALELLIRDREASSKTAKLQQQA